MSYIKAHPFGYKAIKDKPAKHYKDIPTRTQTIIMSNGQVRNITHYDHHSKGKTLAEMVYESYKA